MDIILRAAAAYFVLLLTVRLIGRRLASMMAPFDLVVLFLIGGARYRPCWATIALWSGPSAPLAPLG